jgi:subtilase family protein
MPEVFDHGKVDAVARRFRRRATAAVAAGLAVACAALMAGPAFADQVRDQEWWLGTLHVRTAWESSKGSGVTVAVLDTGVAPAQSDLAGSVTTGPDYTGSGRKAGGPFWGIHGTAVASLIAGHGHGANNADGIIGVAPAAKILSVRVTVESGDPLLANGSIAAGLPGAIAKGIRYAVAQGVGVIDLPLDPAALAGATPGGSTAERDAVAYALSKNVVLVAPGGDGGFAGAVNYPAAYPGVISVGAFDQAFAKATFSSRKSYVTLTAAGDGVDAATPSGYAMLHSTSAAGAVVAGMVALIRAQFPTLTPAQVTSALTQSTVFRPRNGRLNGSGYGTADAQAALIAAARINAAVPTSGSGGAVAAPSSPAVRAQGTSVWAMLQYGALILAGILLLGLFGFIVFGRVRRRRARAARLAPLRNIPRVPVRAQPDFSSTPPSASGQFTGSQFAGSQFAGSQFGGSQFAGSQFAGSQFTGSKLAGSQFGASPLAGSPAAGGQFPGAQRAPAPFPGDAAPAPFPGDAAPAPFPGDAAPAPFPGDAAPAPFPGDAAPAPFPGDAAPAPFPGDAAPAPFPGDAAPAPFPGDAPPAPFPGDAAPAPFPGDQATQAHPGDQAAKAPFPGDLAALAPFPGDQVAPAQLPGSEFPGAAPFPPAAPGNGALGGPATPPARVLPPTPRPSVVRPPRISGRPPWDPAQEPEGELPWAATPPANSAHGLPAGPRRVTPTGGVQPWGPATRRGIGQSGTAATGGNAPPGGTDLDGPAADGPGSESMIPDKMELGGRTPGSMPLPAPQSGRGESAGDDDIDDDGGRPIYVWNPAEVTESFPKLPPSGESGRS